MTTDRVRERHRSLELDQQGLQDERNAFSFDHGLSPSRAADFIPQLHYPLDSRLLVEPRVSPASKYDLHTIAYTHTLEVPGWVVRN
jgi:hypothetical protein